MDDGLIDDGPMRTGVSTTAATVTGLSVGAALGALAIPIIFGFSSPVCAVTPSNKVLLRAQQEMPDDPPSEAFSPEFAPFPAPPVRFESFASIQVNVGPGGVNILNDAANEPSIAVDPTHPNRMAIGWRQFDARYSNFREAGWGHTTDGGRTWTFPGVLEEGIFRSDPVLGFDAEGRFYYASLHVIDAAFSVQIFKSWDGGATWPQKISAFGGDKEWITVDRTGGIGRGHIYHAWSVAAGCCADSTFNRSVDGGNRFSTPQTIWMRPVWGTLAVGPDGTLYISGTDINDYSIFYVSKSTSAKYAGASPGFDFTMPVDLGGSLSPMLGGATPNPDGLLGQVWVAVDHSGGPTHGYVYVLASVDPPGADPQDVHFIRSADGGLTWSAPVRVNKDVGTAWQWFATMSVAPTGRIDAVWNDTRYTGLSYLSHLMYSYSMDGGLTWSAEAVLSPAWNSHVGWPNQLKIGDYYDMVSDRVGANLAWAATFNNEQDVYYLRIGDYDCNTNGVGDAQDILDGTSQDANANGIPDECEDYSTDVAAGATPAFELHQNFPNPFNPSTMIRYDVAEAGPVSIRIFDVAGRSVRTLSSRHESPGTKQVAWDGRDDAGAPAPSGVYFVRLHARGFEKTRKMVLIR
jgi:hypothetical protein